MRLVVVQISEMWYTLDGRQFMGSVRLGNEIEERMRRVASIKGITISEVHRAALEEYLTRELAPKRVSRFSDVIGIADSGDGSLSENRKTIYGEILRKKHDRGESA